MFPIQISPEQFNKEMTAFAKGMMSAGHTLSNIKEDDIQYGASPKEAVYQDDKIVLYHFKPVVPKKDIHPVPIIISYALVNRPYMTDLQENRSLVKNLLKAGLDIYLIDWGYPGREDRWLTLDDYINGYINNCVDFVRESHNIDKVNLLGICQGGAFSLCYSSIYPEKIQNLITMVTPVDFNVKDGLLNAWVGCGTGAQHFDAELMVDALGNVSGDFMNYGYVMLKPFTLTMAKYLGMLDIAEDQDRMTDFMRMEKWIFDSPDQAGEAWLQFIQDFFQRNKLIKGEVKIGDKSVDLSKISMPVLNLYAEYDHLVPPKSSQALEKYVSSDDYTETSFPAGHIGMYVSSKVQKTLPPQIAEWVKSR